MGIYQVDTKYRYLRTKVPAIAAEEYSCLLARISAGFTKHSTSGFLDFVVNFIGLGYPEYRSNDIISARKNEDTNEYGWVSSTLSMNSCLEILRLSNYHSFPRV